MVRPKIRRSIERAGIFFQGPRYSTISLSALDDPPPAPCVETGPIPTDITSPGSHVNHRPAVVRVQIICFPRIVITTDYS